ncbi:MAG: hypothetical protein K6F53_01585 [Lachnospiraceae bacterium]|nr:hypothetical protein [Lachnospiraceae bacterium]
MKKSKRSKILCVLTSFILSLLLLPTLPAKAAEVYVEGYVLDAHTLPDGTIGVLFARDTERGEGSNATVIPVIWYGVFDPGTGYWDEVQVQDEGVKGREAALTISDDGVAHVAYTTSSDRIVYIRQTDTGWRASYMINSVDICGDAGVLSAPDIEVDENGTVHVSYIDSRGADDGDSHTIPDVMEAVITGSDCVRKVKIGGWFTRDVGTDRYYATGIPYITKDLTVVSRYNVDSSDGWGGRYSTKSVLFKKADATELEPELNGTLYDACSYDGVSYALCRSGNSYLILDSAGNGSRTDSSISEHAADMTIGEDGKIYYAAAQGSNMLFYQDDTGYVTNSLFEEVHPDHKKMATVIAGNRQHAFYTGSRGHIVWASFQYGNVRSELIKGKEPEDVSEVTFNTTGSEAGKLEGLDPDGTYYYVLNNEASEDFTSVTEKEISIPRSAVGRKGAALSVVKRARDNRHADSEPKTFTITRASVPTLTATQPDRLDGEGTLPTTEAFEYTTDEPGDDPESANWIQCTDAVSVPPGIYYVRYRSDGTVLASDPQEIEIVEYVLVKEQFGFFSFATHGYETAGFSYDEGTYEFSGPALNQEKLASGKGKIIFDDSGLGGTLKNCLLTGKLYVVKKGDGIRTIDSDPYEIELTRMPTPNLRWQNPKPDLDYNYFGTIYTTDTPDVKYNYTHDDPTQNEEGHDSVSWTGWGGDNYTGDKDVRCRASTIYFRTQAKGYALASELQVIVIVNLVRKEYPRAVCTAVGTESILLRNLVPGETYHISMNEDDQDITEFTAESDTKVISGVTSQQGYISIVNKGDGEKTTYDSLAQTFCFKRAVTPNLAWSHPNHLGIGGKIATTEIHEYCKADNYDEEKADTYTWTACTGELTGLEAGTYHVRVKASEDNYDAVMASPAQTIVLQDINVYQVKLDESVIGHDVEILYAEQNKPIAEPAMKGYMSVKWYRDAGMSEEWDFADPVTEDMTLYMTGTPIRYNIYYRNRNGSDSMIQERVFDDGVPLLACTLPPEREGMELLGWTTSRAYGERPMYSDREIANLTAENNKGITLYAIWTEADWGSIDPSDIQTLKEEGKHSYDITDHIWFGKIEPVTFTGASVKFTEEELHVYDGKMLLSPKTDYTVTYTNAKNAGTTAMLKVKGKGNYAGSSVSQSFTINPLDLEDAENNIVFTVKDIPYKNGKDMKSKPVIKHGKTTLKENTDYTLDYGDERFDSVGTVSFMVTGKGNYTGTVSLSYRIYASDHSLSKAVITLDPAYDLTYAGAQNLRCPPVTGVKLNKSASEFLVKDRDYKVTYKNNQKAGNAAVVVEGIGEYSGTVTKTYKIKARPLTVGDITITNKENISYTGKALKPLEKIYVPAIDEYLSASDYTVSYSNNTNAAAKDAGKAPKMTLRFKGNYSGQAVSTFTISPMVLAQDDLKITIPAVKLKKASAVPGVSALKPVVKLGKKTLKYKKDYTLSNITYNSGLKCYEAEIVPQGNYGASSTIKGKFRTYLKQVNLGDRNVFYVYIAGGPAADMTYDGTPKKPVVHVRALTPEGGTDFELIEGIDYTVTYANNTKAAFSDAKKAPFATVKGKGAYKGKRTVKFTIYAIDISSVQSTHNIEITVPDMKYTGRALKPKAVVKVDGKTLKASEYGLEYENNTDMSSSALVKVTGKGNYEGTKKAWFRIYEKSIETAYFGAIANQVYTGSQIRPGADDIVYDEFHTLLPDTSANAVRVYTDKNKTKELYQNRDFRISYGPNLNTGTGTVIIEGIGEYGGKKTLKFKIVPKKETSN